MLTGPPLQRCKQGGARSYTAKFFCKKKSRRGGETRRLAPNWDPSVALQSIRTSMVETRTAALIDTLFEFDGSIEFDGRDVADEMQQASNGAEKDCAPNNKADSLTILLKLLARPSHVVTNPLTNPLTNSWASLLLKMTTLYLSKGLRDVRKATTFPAPCKFHLRPNLCPESLSELRNLSNLSNSQPESHQRLGIKKHVYQLVDSNFEAAAQKQA